MSPKDVRLNTEFQSNPRTASTGLRNSPSAKDPPYYKLDDDFENEVNTSRTT